MKYYICSSTCPQKKESTSGQVCIILHCRPNLATAVVRYGLIDKTNGRATTVVFPIEGCGKKIYALFLQRIFGRDFLSLPITIF